VASIAANLAPASGAGSKHHRSDSKSSAPNSSTFAPSFIKTEDLRRSIDVVRGIEGENDFSGKRYVWLRDAETAFVKGWVVEDLPNGKILVQCDDGTVSPTASSQLYDC
jgi:myosin heavy chain 9/10/11/14